MPLLFQTRMSDSAEWKSLDYDADRGVYLWSHTHEIAGASHTLKSITSLAQQAEILSLHYHAFSYMDSKPLDFADLNGRTSVILMNQHGGRKPNFSAKTLERGWLSPDGEFIGCNFGNHMDLIRLTLSTPLDKARAQGWVMIQSQHWHQSNSSIALTEKQKEALTKLGFDVDQPASERTSVPAFNDVYEGMRQSFIAATSHKDVPVLLDPDAAKAILADKQNIVDQINDFTMMQVSTILQYNHERLAIWKGDPDKIVEIIQDGNRMSVQAFERGDRILALL